MLNRSQPHTHTSCWPWWGDLPWMTFGKVEEKCWKASDVLQTCLKWHNLEFWKSSPVDLDWSNVVIVVTGIDQAGCYWEVLCRAGHWTPGGCAACLAQARVMKSRYYLSTVPQCASPAWHQICLEAGCLNVQSPPSSSCSSTELAISNFPPPSALTAIKTINWN